MFQKNKEHINFILKTMETKKLTPEEIKKLALIKKKAVEDKKVIKK